MRIIATSSHKGTSIDQVNLTGPAAVFIGSEGAGLPRTVLAQADELIAIPHSPQVESLNAGVAGSIVLYEAARQRRLDRSAAVPAALAVTSRPACESR